MRRKLFWLGFALLAFILLIPLCIGLYEKWQVYTRGSIVDVTVTSLPNPLSTNGTLKFKFHGKIYSESSSGAANNYLHMGDTIKMKHLNEYQIFLFVNDNPVGWGVLVILFILL